MGLGARCGEAGEEALALVGCHWHKQDEPGEEGDDVVDVEKEDEKDDEVNDEGDDEDEDKQDDDTNDNFRYIGELLRLVREATKRLTSKAVFKDSSS
jgi:hypothetical protein